MDKDMINHEVVSMRKISNRAKKYFILRFNKKRKRILKNPKDDPNAKKRVDELSCVLTMIRPIKVDDITKLALTENPKSLKKMIQNPSTPQAQKLAARIAANKGIQEKVEKFKSDNPAFKKILKPTFELWKAKNAKKLANKSTKSVVEKATTPEKTAKAKPKKVKKQPQPPVANEGKKAQKTDDKAKADSKKPADKAAQGKNPRKMEKPKNKEPVKKINSNSKVGMKAQVKKDNKTKVKATKAMKNVIQNV